MTERPDMKDVVIPCELVMFGLVVSPACASAWHVLLKGQSWDAIPLERRRSWLLRVHLN